MNGYGDNCVNEYICHMIKLSLLRGTTLGCFGCNVTMQAPLVVKYY